MCTCLMKPYCELYNGVCGRRADWSIMMPISWKQPLQLGPRFACEPCWEAFKKAWVAPIKGLTRPEGVAPEDHRPSLMDVIRHGQIAVAFEESRQRRTPQ